MQQIQEQEEAKAEVIQLAQKRMDREVKAMLAEHEVTKTIKALKRRLNKLLAKAGIT